MAEEEVVATWHRFLEGLPADERLADFIVASWTRCQGFGLDTEHTFPRRVPYGDLQRRMEASSSLLAVAPRHMQWAADVLADVHPHVVILADADGVVLHSIGDDPEIIAAFGLTPGHDWSEQVVGTNGIGTSLAAGKPVAVVGAEHYGRAWHNNTCVGAPIRAADGRLLGAVDLSVTAADGDPARLVLAAFLADVIAREVSALEGGQPPDRAFTSAQQADRADHAELVKQSTRRPSPRNAATTELAAQLAHQAAQLDALSGALVDAGRLADGRLVLRPEPLDLAELAREAAARIVHDGISSHPIVVQAESALVGGWDRQRLEQALGYLLAVAQRRGGASTEVLLEDRGASARIVVRDASLSLSPSDRHRVFDPVSSPDPGEHERPGLVLSLWIVRQIVEAMGGAVEVTTGDERSESFTVVLPKT